MTEQKLKAARRKAWLSGQKTAAVVGACALAMFAELPFPNSLGAALVGALIGAVLWHWVQGPKP